MPPRRRSHHRNPVATGRFLGIGRLPDGQYNSFDSLRPPASFVPYSCGLLLVLTWFLTFRERLDSDPITSDGSTCLKASQIFSGVTSDDLRFVWSDFPWVKGAKLFAHPTERASSRGTTFVLLGKRAVIFQYGPWMVLPLWGEDSPEPLEMDKTTFYV
jgi:hypothetical protein